MMLTGPIPATQKVLGKTGRGVDDIGVVEANDAIPLGSSGAVVNARMRYQMRNNGIRYGLQTMCEGGGTANPTVAELIDQRGLLRRDLFIEDHEAFREFARDFIEKEFAPAYPQWKNAWMPREAFAKLGEIGIMVITPPAESGGGGQDDCRNNAALQEGAVASW